MATVVDRREFMGYFAGIGLSTSLFPGVLWAKISGGADITVETIASAEEVAGITFDPGERELMLDGLKQQEQRRRIEAEIPQAEGFTGLAWDPRRGVWVRWMNGVPVDR